MASRSGAAPGLASGAALGVTGAEWSTGPAGEHAEASRRLLVGARDVAQASAGELIVALRRAADAAPDKPGFWANVGDAFGHAASGLGHVLTDVGVGTLKTLASLGTAMTEHPEDLVAAAAGIALMAASAGGALGGGALTLTGAGAVVGVPVSAVSVAGVAVGATMVLAAAGDLANHAAGDDRVQSDAAKGDAERAGPPPDGARMPVDEVMEAGQRWLGPGYGEPVPGSGRYVSSDGLRVFRIGESDITGKHGGGIPCQLREAGTQSRETW